MPRRLWRRTGLDFVSVELASPDPAAPAALWQVWPLDGTPPPGLPIPVVDLSPEPMEHLARLVSGRAAGPVNGAALYTRAIAAPGRAFRDESAHELVRRFRETASPQALALARHLAAAPLTLPVMRLVQRSLLPATTDAQFAEVYLSGLLRRIEPSPDADASAEQQFEFREGVRELLLAELPPEDALAVLTNASSAMPGAAAFASLLAGDDEPALLTHLPPFATVAATVLRRLGGRYTRLATRITALTEPPERHEVDPPTERPLWADAAARIAGALRRGPVVLRGGADARMLALDYLRHGDGGGAVWLDADMPALLRLSLRDLTSYPYPREQRPLVVLDQAAGPTEILPLLSERLGGVVVLSDHPGWSAHGTVLDVAALDPESADHLLARYRVPAAQRAGAVSAARGRPWLLDLIGRAWRHGGFDDLVGAVEATAGGAAALTAALEAYVRWLQQEEPAAADVLTVAAGFAGPPFAIATLVAAAADPLGPGAGADPRPGLGSLLERGLLDARSATGKARLPAEVRDVVRRVTGTQTLRRGERAVLGALRDPGAQRAGPWMSAHLEPFEAADVDDARTRSALTAAIGWWLAAGDAQEALRLAEGAWLRRAGRLGPGHPDTVRAQLLLAWALLGEGRPAAAAPVFRDAGRTLRRGTPDRLGEAASAASGIVAALRRTGDLAGARRQAWRFYAQCRRRLPRRHPVRTRAARELAAVAHTAARRARRRH